MHEHARAHDHSGHAQPHLANNAVAPGKATQHEHGGAAVQKSQAGGSIFNLPKKEHDEDKAKEHGGAKANASSGGEIHIITRAGLRHLRHDGKEGRDAARVLYNNSNAYVVCKEGQTIPKGWKCHATVLFPSYTEFEAAANAGRIPKSTSAVVYDNEHWAQTPHYEKTNAMHYAKLFGQLADKLNLKYIAAPTRKWFAADARYADIIDVQLQSREVHTGSYERALRHSVMLAKRLNPDIKVVAQISSNRNHLDPDHSGNIGDGIENAERDILGNLDIIDGFWGYLYQQNKPSIKAGQKILEDLAAKRRRGVKV